MITFSNLIMIILISLFVLGFSIYLRYTCYRSRFYNINFTIQSINSELPDIPPKYEDIDLGADNVPEYSN